MARIAMAQVCLSGIPCQEPVGCVQPWQCNVAVDCNSYPYAAYTQKCLGSCSDPTSCGCREDLKSLPCTTNPVVCFNKTVDYASDNTCPAAGIPCAGYYNPLYGYNYTCPNGYCSWGPSGCKSQPITCPANRPYCWQQELCLPIEMKSLCLNTAYWCDDPTQQYCTAPQRCAQNATACCKDPNKGARFLLLMSCANVLVSLLRGRFVPQAWPVSNGRLSK